MSKSRGHKVTQSTAIAVAAASSLWLIFTFVVKDPALFLEYVQALVWPCVLITLLIVLRAPLRDKMRQLLNIEGFGFKAGFDRQLQHDLQGAIDNVIGRSESEHRTPNSDSINDANSTETLEAKPRQTQHGEEDTDEQEVEDQDDSVPAPMDESDGLGPKPANMANADESSLNISHESDDALCTIEEALRLEPVDPKKQPKLRLARIQHAILKLQGGPYNDSFRTGKETRESIETIVRRSADWGYDVAKSGSPRLQPDIEWSPDGGWSITTEIPLTDANSAQASIRAFGKATANRNAEDRRRHIDSLEKQIHEMNYKLNSPKIGWSDTGLRVQLEDYKSKLRSIDPGNPFSR